jgi:hypothetical protein
MASKLLVFLAAGLFLRTAGAHADAAAVTGVDPVPLAGLWSITLGGDFSDQSGEDLPGFYPGPAAVAASPRIVPGYYLQGRKYISDSFFALASLSSLPKSYSLSLSGNQDQYDWDALVFSTGGGWMLYRALNFGLSAQAEVGWLALSEGSFQRSGAAPTSGSFSGSAVATQFSLGGLWFILPSVALDLSGGYRFARVPLSFSPDANDPSPGFPSQIYADFSGAYGRAGLSFFWGLRNPWGQSPAPPPPSEGPPRSE